ncbi:MAG: hypothetical protein ACPG5B_13075 [Chitinophagales bacterium]
MVTLNSILTDLSATKVNQIVEGNLKGGGKSSSKSSKSSSSKSSSSKSSKSSSSNNGGGGGCWCPCWSFSWGSNPY